MSSGLGGSGIPSRPRPEEVVGRSRFDQNELTARLYRSRGKNFGAKPPTVKPLPRPRSQPLKALPSKHVTVRTPALRGNYVRGQSEEKESHLVVSKRKQRGLLSRPVGDDERAVASFVEVPQPLRPLLGSKVSLRTSTYRPNRAVRQAGGDDGVEFFATGKLPSSQLALKAMRAKFDPAAALQASAHQAVNQDDSEEVEQVSTDAAKSKEEYQRYLKNPFSFIDKVIESPYTEEFVYLNPRGPYDLEIVKHDKVNPQNYYTMSRAGVTHFYHNETDFTALDQWEREFFLFIKMMEIPFFKKFRMWKAFYFWKKLIGRQKSTKCRKYLQENLYILNPFLRDSLIKLRNLCYSASKWTLFKVDPKNTLTLDEYREAQENQKNAVIESLERLNADVQSIVLEACEVDLREFLVSNGFRKAKQDGVGGSKGGPEDDYSQKISHAEKAAIRTKCRKLTKFIRLADYFIIDTLVTLCIERTSDVLKFVEMNHPTQIAARQKAEAAKQAAKEAASKPGFKVGGPLVQNKDSGENPLFCTELVMADVAGETTLTFSPTVSEFQAAVDESIDAAIKRVMATKRLINDNEFLQYTQVIVEDGDDDQSAEFKLESMVLDRPEFMETKQGITVGLASGFEAAAEHARSFEEYKILHLENVETDIDSFRDSPATFFHELVQKYEAQMELFKEMPVANDVEIVRVDSSALKTTFLPSPKRCLTELQAMLPVVANEKTVELLEELRKSNNKVKKVPDTVEEFVEIMAFLQKTQENSEQTHGRFMAISDIYGLMQECKIRVQESDKTLFDRLAQTKNVFKNSVMLAEASSGGNVDRFNKELDKQIPVLISDTEEAIKTLDDPLVGTVDASQDEVLAFLEEREANVAELEAKAKRYAYYQQVLQVEELTYERLRECRADLDIKTSMWSSLKSWDSKTTAWREAKFDTIDVEEIGKQVAIYNKVYSKAKRMLEGNGVVQVLRDKIVAFQDTLPVVTDLRNKFLQEHHWADIVKLLEHDVPNDPEFTLGKLIELNAMKHKMEISVISVKASQEASLNDMLDKVANTFSQLNLPVSQHKNAKDIFILGGLDDVVAALDEGLMAINTILGSRYVDPIRAKVSDWNAKLLLLQDTLDEWATCQRQWMYLETIFSSQDIIHQLPEEASDFQKVDKSWKEIMRSTNDVGNAIEAGCKTGLLDILKHNNEVLDRVQKRLESYLETKRRLFPRFYFLSNDELLQILAQSKNHHAVQPHLRKCFENIVSVDFKDKDIKAMNSGEGEKIALGANLKVRGSVEQWLSNLEGEMVKSLRKLMKQGVINYDKMGRGEFVEEHFSQIVMTVTQIAWCVGCEEATDSDEPLQAMKDWLQVQLVNLAELVAMVRGDLSKQERKKLVALITTDVHGRDVTQTLIEEKVTQKNDFNWQQQLRFYWDQEKDDCVVRQANAHFMYGYEYMGITSRLVITPLTDRCWMTITGALHLGFGASPAGPAGTGKTESTKDLAKAMGIFCIVFNCSDQINYKTMAKLFSGLAQCGSWTCLDEFNRIDIEVLSVVAQQLLQIRQALLAGLTNFNFQDSQINLRPGFGVMITMNPGYAGRTELPDNLKVLFRPVAMMIPDYARIAEIMLFAEGFDSAPKLSGKMTKLYKLSSEQLSQQDHYDFGMRAVKSVLVMAGALKRAEPDLEEDIVLIRAMRDSNVPKFLSDDIPLFNAIVQDLFPGAEIPPVIFEELENAVSESIEEMGLQNVPAFGTKVMQLFDTFNVRFGVMIVGPTGAGKSSCYNVLQKSMTRLRAAGSPNELFNTVHTHVMNPKCVTMGELYGDINAMTGEWTDGLAATIMRDAIKDNSPDRHWVVFDGPVDALWIENMNTVLDDNMTLCLVSGERIKLKHELRMLFEVADLAVASPATVSRCGMVYMTPSDLGFLPYVRSWIPHMEKLSQPCKDHLYSLFKLLTKTLKKLRATATEPIPTVDVQVATSVCLLFEALFTEQNGVNYEDPEEELNTLIDMVFAFSFAWGVGGSLDENSQAELQRALPDMFANNRPPGAFFDYFVNIKEKAWQSWESKVPEFEFNPKMEFFQMLVPTENTVRLSVITETLLEIERSVFLTGLSGVGKSVIIQNMFSRFLDDGKPIVSVLMAFSAQTNARVTQESIESKLIKLKKGMIGAPAGKKVVIFVDDVNMPRKEEYGAQPPIELLRQFQDYKGFYDRVKLTWKNVVDTTLLCASAPPGGGRSELTPRFTRHFNILCAPSPDEKMMAGIFGKMITGFLSAGGFKAPVQKLNNSLVTATIDMYTTISAELLPTPTKSHYTFNLRDISKVFQGIMMVKAQNCKDPDTMIRLWMHECQRCFHDRLIDDVDRLWFTEKVITLLQRSFGVNWSHEDMYEKKNIMFADFLQPGMDKNYMENTKYDVNQLFQEYLEEYNMSSTQRMDLVFFKDACDHLSRLLRVLRQPRGNAMLVGVGGSGKQSLARLATAISEYKLVTIELTRGYGYSDFQELLKEIFQIAGVEGQHCVFLVNENQLVQERFLEDINNILNSGEVPNLYPNDELMKLYDDMMPVVRELGRAATRPVLFSTFVERVRANLHIILCMSPVGESFRVRCRQFPSLINCCTIDWYTKWPREALINVSTSFLKGLQLPSEEIREGLAEACVQLHQAMEATASKFERELRRKVYTTPKSYLDLIGLYLSMLGTKREELTTKLTQLKVGLDKLKTTSEIVAELAATLDELKPTLIVKSKETAELLEQVSQDQADADKVKAVIQVEEKAVNKQAAEVAEVQAEAQADLDLALPALKAAIKALDGLKKSEISEIKSMANPPTGVKRTMEAVCILLEEKPDWDVAKKVMGNTQFLTMLKELDKDNIAPKVITKLQKYVTDPEFTPDAMMRVSNAAASLCMWVNSMVVYSKVAKEVGPKKARVAEMNEMLKTANATLKEKQDQLAEVVAKVDALRAKCDSTLAEKNELNFKLEQTEGRLDRANKLTSGLGGEAVRWKADAEQLTLDLELLVGNVFLSSACISYMGPFTGSYREELVTGWKTIVRDLKIPMSEDFSLQATLGNPVDIRNWNINGLPTDNVSIDSGIAVVKGSRWPLCIDPQEQAKKWIKNEYKDNLVVLRFSEADVIRPLEAAIRNGKPVLIEDIGEEVDSAIDPILLRQTFLVAGRKQIRLGDSDVDYDDEFKLFMTTKLPNPHYLPEVCIKVTLLNFTVTPAGLEEQLLGEVVKTERPDVEEKRNRLIVTMAEDRAQLADLEARILRSLSESKGNILDDQELIDTLKESKDTSNIIQDRVKETVVTQEEIRVIREEYRPAAERGSILFFVISDLCMIDPMYQNSLTSFYKLFNICLENSEPSLDLKERVKKIMDYCTLQFYSNICRGLFEKHKLLYSFLITCKILLNDGRITMNEWNLLLRGNCGIKPDMDKSAQNPAPDILEASSWTFLCTLEQSLPDVFGGFTFDFAKDFELWKEYMDSPKPVAMDFLGKWGAKDPVTGKPLVTDFHKLLLIKGLRWEKLVFAFSEYITNMMGRAFVETPPVELREVHKDTDFSTPIVFVLSVGADPTSILFRYAKEVGFDQKLHVISLGQGQGDNAKRLVSSAQASGEWVLLQNCHLARSWMPDLEMMVDNFEKEIDTHEDFRLWLTSMPTSYFPVSVLQKAAKVTNEPPKGMRANLRRSYQGVVQEDEFETCSKKGPWKKLLFGLCFFHATVQERKKFGPLGWNIMYEFNDSDLETSVQVLRMFLDEQPVIPWDALRYVCGQINYGGRVTDDWDRRCLTTIMNRYYNTAILADDYKFSPSGIYFAPPEGEYSSYVDYIASLPQQADPEIFGMHENANISFQQQETDATLKTIVSIQPRDAGGGGGKTSDEIVSELAAELAVQLPPLIDFKAAGTEEEEEEEKEGGEGDEPEAPTAAKPMSSLQIVLAQEIIRFNKLLKTVKKSLGDLQMAIKGEVVMSPELDLMFSSLLNNQVPELWNKVSYPSLKPLASWFEDLKLRIEFMASWNSDGVPNSFWISGFFFPQGFMTGVLQTHARKYSIAIDTLSYSFKVQEVFSRSEVELPPEDGVLIDGLFMDGGRWDMEKKVVVDSQLGALYPSIPIIHLLPVTNYRTCSTDYPCPVYKTSTRAGMLSTTGMSTNFVLAIDLPSEKPPEYWVLKGTAFLCQLDA